MGTSMNHHHVQGHEHIHHPQEDAVLTSLCRHCRSFALFSVTVDHFLSLSGKCVCVCSVVSNSFVNLWTVAHQAPLSMEVPRQEYWSGLLFPSPGDLPTQGLNPHLFRFLHWQVFIKVESYNMNSFLSDHFYSA